MPPWPSFFLETIDPNFLLFGSQQISIVQSIDSVQNFSNLFSCHKLDELTIPIMAWIDIVLVPNLLVVLIFELVVLILRCGSVL